MKSREKMDKKSTGKGSSANTAGIGMAAGMNAPFKPSREEVKMQARYRAEDDLRTLHRAHEIVTDKPRHGAVKALAAQQTKAVMKFGKK